MDAYCWIQICENSLSQGSCILFISTILGSDLNLELERAISCLSIAPCKQLCEFTSNLFIIYMLLKGDLQYKLFSKTHLLPPFHKKKLKWLWVISVETRENKQKQTINSNKSVCHPVEEEGDKPSKSFDLWMVACSQFEFLWPLCMRDTINHHATRAPSCCCFHKYIERKKKIMETEQPRQP